MPEARLGVYLKRRALLAMKRTAAPKLVASLSKINGLTNKLHKVSRLTNSLFILISYHSLPPAPLNPNVSAPTQCF